MFSCKLCEKFKEHVFTEHLRTTASEVQTIKKKESSNVSKFLPSICTGYWFLSFYLSELTALLHIDLINQTLIT